MTELDKNRLLNGLRRYLTKMDDATLLQLYADNMQDCDECHYKYLCGASKLPEECYQILCKITEEHDNA